MGETIEETRHIYEKAMALMDEREKDYECSWREEGLDCMIGSLYKKGSQLRTMLGNGRLRENTKRTKEDILDNINYGILAYRHLELEEMEEQSSRQ